MARTSEEENALAYRHFAVRYPMYRVTSQLLVDFAAIFPGMHVVDLGCGSGETAIQIANRLQGHGRIMLIDKSKEMLSMARERLAKIKGLPQLEFIHISAEHFSDITVGPVHAVVCNCAIWQMNFERVLGQVSNALGSGDRFVFNTYPQWPLPVDGYVITERGARGCKIVVDSTVSYHASPEEARRFFQIPVMRRDGVRSGRDEELREVGDVAFIEHGWTFPFRCMCLEFS